MNRNRRIFDDDDNDRPREDALGWTRSRKLANTATRDRRNGVSRDPLGEVREIVQDEWRETLDDNFNPITLALDMLDTSSLGRARDLLSFRRTNEQIEQALQSTVNEHYQGFNSSIGTYGQMDSSIKQSQLQVKNTRDALLRAKVQLSSKRMDLLEMSTRSNQYKDMIRLLRDISDLRKVPDELENHLSSKHFLHAVELLNNATSTANREDMSEIPALSDIRQYLKGQVIHVLEILVEELHNHLYLKSPYSDGLWTGYVPDQSDLPVVHYERQRGADNRKVKKFSTIGRLQMEMHMAKHNAGGSIHEPLDDQHPESDPFRYLQILTQALHDLGKLPYALDVMIQRLPSELYLSVERTISEVKSRHPGSTTTRNESLPVAGDADVEALEPLKDLLWTTFSKWDAILQSHRILYDTVGNLQEQAMGSRSGKSGVPLAYDFAEVWKPFESELRSILISYLSPLDQHSDVLSGTNDTMQQVFSKRHGQRSTQGVFSIARASASEDKQNDNEEQELREMLQNSVPGLLAEKTEASNLTMSLARSRNETSKAGHQQMLNASPFNIAILLQPTVALLNRAKRIVPTSATVSPGNLDAFLNEFLDNVFASQFADAVESLYEKALGDIVLSGERIAKDRTGVSASTKRLLDLVKRLVGLLEMLPTNRHAYMESIYGLIGHYHQRCSAWLTSITANDKPDAHLGALKLSAAWASRQTYKDIWEQYHVGAADPKGFPVAQEVEFIFDVKKDLAIRPQDLMQDPHSIESLITLYHSITQFARAFQGEDAIIVMPKTEVTKEAANQTNQQAKPEALQRFLEAYTTLARTILRVLRLELRAHVLYYLQITLSQGNYNLEEKANEIDTTLADLNADLLAISLPLRALNSVDYGTVMLGLAQLVNDVLIEDSSSISIMTRYGSEKLLLGISALQQNLRNLVSDPVDVDLSQAVKFYESFALGPMGLSDRAATGTLGLDYPRAAKLMGLMYSAELHRHDNRGNRDSISAKRKQLNEHLALLSSLMAGET